MRTFRNSSFYKFVGRVAYSIRTMARRTIWGDRLFLQFKGPATILLSSRGVRVADVLTNKDINEIADAPAGEAPAAVELALNPKPKAQVADQSSPITPSSEQNASAIHVATVQKDGKVTFEDKKDLKEFIQ